ncbi:hypothetical protein VTJ83DRAFT_7448 [Remersonia thermophila]|uniref:C2H2-type domain-containing protein n=1 Tax=Remersonia thermophila TaxID=72144 RepID=A0ABR4D3J6_9PEZI
MDRSRYGLVPSSSSAHPGLQRPLPMHPMPCHFQPKITPKTGRISKAKKGLPVHVCDICRPPKTFTRAEHLRRHQLSHEAPQYRCPGCDKAFHRPDLLARHQQKHEHEGDHASRPASTQHSPRPAGTEASSSAHRPSAGTTGPELAVSASANDSPQRPSGVPAGGNRQTPRSASSHASNSAYRAAPQTSPHEHAYTISPRLSMMSSTQPSAGHADLYHATSSMGDYQPRSGPPPIYVVTQGLPLPSLQTTDVPELHPPSPWPSSASDSTYSTPVSDVSRNARPWSTSQRLSPYPGSVPRSLHSSAPSIESLPAPHSSLYGNALPSEHSFGTTLSLSSSSMEYPGHYHHHHSLGASSTAAVRSRQNQQQAHSLSSIRGRTPPGNSSSHGTDVLLSSASGFSDHLDAMGGLDRRKAALVGSHHDLLSTQMQGGAFGALGGYGSSAAASPGADSTSHGSGIVAELDLALGADGCGAMPTPLSLAIPLPGPVRAAIPRYLELYWQHVDPVLPFIHRQTFEAAPEDVLRCAMAAFATQHLDDKEDRTRGNQLHEFAWQEIKRIPQWSIQTMQAILLCEYFARFRGRKAVTRPSKPFESLCSRALYHQNPAILDPQSVLSTDGHHLSLQDRWRNWIDAESRRRLLAACVFADGHMAVYQQQRRAMDDGAGAAGFLSVPLFGRSGRLWRASSAEEWFNALSSDPSLLNSDQVPPLERLTRDDIVRRGPVDGIIILDALARHLPRNQRTIRPVSLSADNSPASDAFLEYHHVHSASGQLATDHQQQQQHQAPYMHQHHQPSRQSQPGVSTTHGGQPDHHRCSCRHPLDVLPYPSPSSAAAAGAGFDAEERIRSLFPDSPIANTYLALHHTPLRDLLAVSGDSWVFSQKILPAALFVEHQRRLRVWATATAPVRHASSSVGGEGTSAARATVYAARAILGFLAREQQPSLSGPSTAWSRDMSDYWALYVCALVCWAFAHPAGSGRKSGGGNANASSSSSSSGGGGGGGGGGGDGYSPSATGPLKLQPIMHEPNTRDDRNRIQHDQQHINNNDDDGDEEEKDEPTALSWLRTMASTSLEQHNSNGSSGGGGGGGGGGGMTLYDTLRWRQRDAAAGVVALVRRRLERDCVGGRSRLYVDAVGVLRKLEEGRGGKWF